MKRWPFNLRQLGIAVVTMAAVIVLIASIHRGLLGLPDMQIAGNGSSASTLRWFADRSGPGLPTPSVISAPGWTYNVAMLAWSLWLALALLQRWLKWAWESFTAGAIWITAAKKPPKTA